MLKIDQLSASVEDKTILKGLNLEVKPGEIFGFLGPNGAGKTTTIKMLAGLLKPSSGTVTIDGSGRSNRQLK